MSRKRRVMATLNQSKRAKESSETEALRALLEAQGAAQTAALNQPTKPIVTINHSLPPVSPLSPGVSPLSLGASPLSFPVTREDNSGAPDLDPSEVDFDAEKDFIGRGVFGKVYKGTCRGQVVAVKVPINPEQLTDAQLAEFRQEVAMLKKVYHPNVLLFLGAAVSRDNFMIVTQFMPRGSLDALLKSDVCLGFDERLRMAKDVALGLSWLHNISKIVHRDLKPANLLLDDHFRVKITDFGFAQLRQLVHEREEQPRGSVLWMAPELLMGRTFDQAVDIFSFSIVLWQLLANRPLYENKYADLKPFVQAVCLQHERPTIRKEDVDITPPLEALLRRGWHADPSERCSAEEVCSALDLAYIARVVDVPSTALVGDGETVSGDVSAETLEARAFWRLVTKGTTLPLPSAGDVTVFERELKARLLRSGDLVDSFVKHHVRVAAGVTTLSTEQQLALRSSGVNGFGDGVVQTNSLLSVERFVRLLASLGPWLPPASPDAKSVEVAETVLACADRLAKCAWYHPEADKELAERRLANRLERTFLVRMSGTHADFPFTISLMRNAAPAGQSSNMQIQHKRIQRVYDRADPNNCQWLVAGSSGVITAYSDFFAMIESPALALKYACERNEVMSAYM